LYYNHKQKPQAYLFCLLRPVTRYRNGKRYRFAVCQPPQASGTLCLLFHRGPCPFPFAESYASAKLQQKKIVCVK
jgi:hypothetical protein